MGNAITVAETTATQLYSLEKQREDLESTFIHPSDTNHQQKIPLECPMHNKNEYISGCPIQDKPGNINPLNMMPKENQKPSPGQPFPLPTERQTSTIPKAIVNEGESPYWEYPSPQMFWNAMLRRGWRWKKEDLTREDMDNIIKIHNFNNERAWQEILKWEKALHGKECSCPKLKSFGGKASDYTPKAIMNWLLGNSLPFDRHDWIVDRCGKDVKYVIDYYGGNKDDKRPKLAILDVRPAINSLENVWDRLTVAYWRLIYSKD